MPFGLKYAQLTLLTTQEILRQLATSSEPDAIQTELAHGKAHAVLDLRRLLVNELHTANNAAATTHRYDEERMRALIPAHPPA